MADSSIRTIVDRRLCCGCGACFVACPGGAVEMVAGEHYNYAKVDEHLCTECRLCLEVCPQSGDGSEVPTSVPAEPLSCCLVHASDEAVRREASSGGFVTALLVHLLEKRSIMGAVVVRASARSPFVQEAFVARSAEDVFGARGSRYTPVSACAALREVHECSGRYAFVGKPCEIHALRNLQRKFPEFRDKVVLAIGLFCAQTPARSRTKALLESRGIDPQRVHVIAYRGAGWPGRFRAWNKTSVICEVPYHEAWDYLATGAPAVSCLLCPDGVASEGDLSVGDPWFLASGRPMGGGRTLVVAWTEAAREAVADAAFAGAIVPYETGDECRVQLRGTQALRKAAAAGRRAVYRAVLGEPSSLVGLLRSRFTCLPTLLRRRWSRVYY